MFLGYILFSCFYSGETACVVVVTTASTSALSATEQNLTKEYASQGKPSHSHMPDRDVKLALRTRRQHLGKKELIANGGFAQETGCDLIK